MPILKVVVGPKFSGSIDLLRVICEEAILKANSKKIVPSRHLRLVKTKNELYMGMDIVFDIIPLCIASRSEAHLITRITEFVWDALIRQMPYLSFGYWVSFT